MRERMKKAGPVCVAFCFTVFFIGILELYLNNIGQFPYTWKELLGPTVLLFLASSAVLLLLVSLIRGRAFEVVLSILTGLLLGAYIQGNFLHGDLGELTGDAIDWMSRTGYGIGNAALWIVLAGLPLAVYLIPRTRKFWQKLMWLLPVMVIGMQTAGMAATVVQTDFSAEEGIYNSQFHYLSDEGIFELSAEKNVLVFLLDRLDVKYIDQVLADEPGFLDDLEGFTYYPDYTAMYARTYPSVGYLLTGQVGYFDKSAGQYFDEAYREGTFLPDLKTAGYTTKLYMSDYYCYTDVRQLEGLADNIADRGAEIRLNRGEMLALMCQFTAFRYMPFLLKQFFWLSPESFKRAVTVESESVPFDTDSFRFKEELDSDPFTVQNETKNFMYLHLKGSHAAYDMDEEGNILELGTGNVVDQTKGYFHLVKRYLDEMKRLGLYENATIIILGDHGVSEDTEDLDRYKTTGFFVKPAGVSEGKLAVSKKQVSQANFQATVIEEAGLDTDAYGPSVFDIGEEEETVRRFLYKVDGNENHEDAILQEFEIRGKASDFANWTFIRDYPVLFNH